MKSCLTIAIAILLLTSGLANAQELCEPEHCAYGPDSSGELKADALILDAWRAEAAGEWSKARFLYGHVAVLSAAYRPLASLGRVRAYVEDGAAAPKALLEAVQRGPAYPGRDLVLLRARTADGLTPDLVASALAGVDREDVCEFLASSNLVSAEIMDTYYGRCTVADFSNWKAKHTPSAAARLDRAKRMYGEVRFRAANAELEAIDLGKLELEQQCQVQFRVGRTVYRLRRRDDSEAAFRWVRDQCSSFPDPHIRSLYAIGKRRFEKGDLKASKAAFQTIVKTYPARSHADDAWFYLARIARNRADRKSELAALDVVLRDHRDGDMLFEMVWEVYEGMYRADEFQAFVSAIQSVDLPAQDDRYYSQGRLEYFLATSLRRLNRGEEANQYLTSAWRKYPFSFYGYLSWVRLKDQGQTPPAIVYTKSQPEWTQSPNMRVTPTARLLRGDVAQLASLATVELGASEAERWWTALAHHKNGDFHVSHNIVRRKIPNRPWHQHSETALTASALQWEMAWPNPFKPQVEGAVDAESAQFGTRAVDPALPTAIMREESSFIEDIESYAGALGLMQLMPRTALAHDDDVEGDATVTRLKTADVNVRVGVDHIYWLAKRFDGHPALMVSAYNAGSGAVGKWLKRQPNDDIALFVEDIPYLQTRDYTKRVIGSYAAYQWLEGRAGDLDRRVGRAARK